MLKNVFQFFKSFVTSDRSTSVLIHKSAENLRFLAFIVIFSAESRLCTISRLCTLEISRLCTESRLCTNCWKKLYTNVTVHKRDFVHKRDYPLFSQSRATSISSRRVGILLNSCSVACYRNKSFYKIFIANFFSHFLKFFEFSHFNTVETTFETSCHLTKAFQPGNEFSTYNLPLVYKEVHYFDFWGSVWKVSCSTASL